jgi:integration host factor subunit beta
MISLNSETVPMTKADLIDAVAERLKLPRGRAELLVGQIFDSMVEALRQGEGIEIRGFGSFSIREYKEYQGRNPRTGETVHVKPKRLAFFKVGKELRERVNASRKAGVVLAVDHDPEDAHDDDELEDDDSPESSGAVASGSRGGS